jgi:hypothetical protein
MGHSNIDDNFAEKSKQAEPDHHEDSLINHIARDAGLGAGLAAGALAGAELGGKLSSGLGEQAWKSLGLPTVDVTGFEQEAPYHSQGTVKDIMHDIKHAFVKDETLDERIRHHVESKMTPEEHKKFDDENKALADHERKVVAWGMSSMIPPPPYPVMPDTPMHKEIGRRAEQLEKQITDQVKSQMSPTDLIRLDVQMKDYTRRFQDATTIHNPLGTGEGFKPMPKPGNAIKDYYDRIAEATDQYISKH